MIEKVEMEFTIASNIVTAFAEFSTDNNPFHLGDEYASNSIFKRRIPWGMYCVFFFSTIIANQRPWLGSIY